MKEFLYNCSQWFMNNYKQIIMTLTSSQFIALISSLILLIKTIATTKNNTVASTELKTTLDSTNAMSNTVSEIKTQNEFIKNENVQLKKELENIRDEYNNAQDTIAKKLNCMLEVQSLVYSTIKDDTIRNTVNSILINAKYAETETRAKLKEEVAQLKEKLEAETTIVKNTIEEATETINKIVEPEKIEFTRY